MNNLMLACLIMFFSLIGCSKPEGTVYEDLRLSQEEVIKFCMVGNIGRINEQQNVIIDELAKEDCHRIFLLGNLVYPDGVYSVNDPLIETSFTNLYEDLFYQNPALVVNLLLGKKEHLQSPEAWRELSLRDARYFFPNYFYFVDYGGLCFVGLDTSFYLYENSVSEIQEQKEWLQEQNEKLNSCDIKIALTAHSYEEAEGDLREFYKSEILGTFDLLITGNPALVAEVGVENKTRIFASGAGSEKTVEGEGGYIVLRWEPQNPKRIGYRVHLLDVPDDSMQMQQERATQRIQKKRVESGWLSEIKDLLFN